TVLAEASDEVRLLGRLILRCIPVVDAPEDAHPAQGPLEINVLDFFTDNLFGIKRTLFTLAVAEDLKIVVEGVVLRVALRCRRIRNGFGQANDLAPDAVIRHPTPLDRCLDGHARLVEGGAAHAPHEDPASGHRTSFAVSFPVGYLADWCPGIVDIDQLDAWLGIDVGLLNVERHEDLLLI